MAASLDYKVHHYAPDRELQRVGVWPVDLEDKSKYWIIYIHGGAWIDPAILHETFIPSIDKLLSPSTSSSPSSSTKDRIAAFASLDYRLTADQVNRPQDPATTPASQLRDAKHPDHARDVAAGLAYLQDRYGFGSRYVLLGHSAGATLVFQAIADLTSSTASTAAAAGDNDGAALERRGATKFVNPQAAVGLCGIYDLNALWDRTGGSYTFIRSVFGPDRTKWDAASPARFPSWSNTSYSDIWHTPSPSPSSSASTSTSTKKKPVVILASSPDDELIAEEEVLCMHEAIKDDAGLDYELVRDMRGKHDEVWEKGEEVARVVRLALDKLAASP